MPRLPPPHVMERARGAPLGQDALLVGVGARVKVKIRIRARGRAKIRAGLGLGLIIRGRGRGVGALLELLDETQAARAVGGAAARVETCDPDSAPARRRAAS